MIKKTYIVAFTIVLLVVFTTSYSTYQMNKKIQVRETVSILKDMSNTASSQYDSIFFQICGTVKLALGDLNVQSLDRDKLKKRLKAVCTNSYYIDELHIINEDSIISSSDELDFNMEKFNSLEKNGEDFECLGLLQSTANPNVFFGVTKYTLADNKAIYFLVGLNYANINEIAKPYNYGSFDSNVYFISDDGYILYHPNKILKNKNLFTDEKFIKEYGNLSDLDYNRLLRNTTNLKGSKNNHFQYKSFDIEKIAFVKTLDDYHGTVVIAADYKAISKKYLMITIRILMPLIFCFIIACYILARYIYLITYTDYFTEIKNNLAFQKHLKKVSKFGKTGEKYLVLKIDHIIDTNDKDFLFDDKVFYSLARKIRTIKQLYSDVYRVSRLCYIFVLDSAEHGHEVVDLLGELKQKIEHDPQNKFYIRGSVLPLEVKDVDILKNNANIDDKIFKYMENVSYLLPEVKDVDFVEYSDILNNFDKRIRDRAYIENIIENKEIVPFYQPIVDVTTGSIYKHEVLMRTNTKNSPLTTPEIILIAEEENLVEKIDYSIIKQAFFMYKNRLDDFKTATPLSINLSCKSVHREMVSFIIEMTKDYDIDPKDITFELTETATIEHLSKTIHYLNQLRKYGFLIAIDDFGTGYAHVELLSKLSVDYVKIDGIFIKDVENDDKKLKTLNALVYLAKIYDTKIIAEFVENIEVIQVLQRLKIEYAQGYYFGKPESVVKE